MSTGGPLLPRLPVLRLISGGDAVKGPDGIVYSTAPESWLADDGNHYVVKGPGVGLVAAEAVSYQLARAVGLAVPEFVLGQKEGESDLYFASRKMDLRDIEPWLSMDRAKTLASVARIVVFDVWVANRDRNLGNLLPPHSSHTGSDEVVAIDFEKAVSLCSPHPIVETATVAPAELWPSGELGQTLRGTGLPGAFVAELRALPEATVEAAVASVSNTIGASKFGWAANSQQTLLRRLADLGNLVAGSWQ